MKDKKWVIPVISLLAVLLIGAAVWGVVENNKRTTYERYLNSVYQKSFAEVVGYMSNIDAALSKLKVANTPARYVALLSEIWRNTGQAENSLGQLPLSHVSMSGLSNFINQAGDYCYVLSERILDGQVIREEDIVQLDKLYETCGQVADELHRIQQENQLSFQEINEEIYYQSAQEGDTFAQIEKSSEQYPHLIYDGPFSDAITDKEPVGLGEEEVSQEEAGRIAQEWIGSGAQVTPTEEMNGKIATWGFSVEYADGKGAQINIAKKGGEVLWFMANDQQQSTEKPDDNRFNELKDVAKAFADQHGKSELTPTYAQFYNGVAVINMPATQGDVVLYPDLVKIWVSIETKEVVGYEANNYLMNHRERQLPEANVSEKEARDVVSPRLQLETTRKVLIPTDGGEEKLCYEFTGMVDDSRYIVFVNAQTGKEEDILRVLDTDQGTSVI